MKREFKSRLSLVIGLCVLIFPIILSANPAVHAAQTVYWQSSTNSNRWVDKGTLQTTPWDNDTTLYIDVDQSTTYQQIDGFGGCFNELGWDALSALSQTERDNVMKALFDPNTGCKFNICRMPIGSSDYAMNYYSLNDTAGDYAMNNFSIARDRQRLIPYIKAAMVYKPDLKMWGSPWSPPAWMKTSGVYNGGRMIQTSQNLTAYALYMAKTVQAYQGDGLNFYAVHVQNEPTVETNYPSCAWSGAELRDYIKNYLGPKFYNDGINAEIWLGTINSGDYNAYAGTVLADSTANSYITGVGYQWGGQSAIQACHDNYPSKRLMQTETECGNHENDWNYAEHTFGLMKHYFDHWANSYMQWNMVLDQTGLSSWGWAQCSMISVDKNTRVVTYNPQFYCVKHFSYYVKPGAYRVYSGGNYGDKIAFKNPDGETVLVVQNNGTTDLAVAIKFGDQKIKPIIPADSYNTFRVYGGSSSHSAYDQIEAESYNSQSGIQTESCSEGGQNIGWIENGDYAVYNNLDFGSGAASFQARVASQTSGGNIELRLDSLSGTLIGTAAVSGTGGWQNWTTVSCNTSGTSGIHNLYLKFTGGSGYLFNVNWFKFIAGGSTTIVNDNTIGTGNNQFEYVGTWNYSTNDSHLYNNDDHWSNTTNNYYQVRFYGTQIKLYDSKNPVNGIGGVSIDGGAETMVDYYAASQTNYQLIYTSPTLTRGNHTLKVRVTGTKNGSATNYYINADRVDITP